MIFLFIPLKFQILKKKKKKKKSMILVLFLIEG